ncbi:MAG: DUF3037 domain-containing protein [Sphingobacteriaceae bacterium]
MQEQHLFEYAVIRVVPRVEREEFVNAGVILYCAAKRFLEVRLKLDINRMTIFSDDLNMSEIETNLHAFNLICAGGKAAGPIGLLDPASRFRWLTAARSTVLQTSRVHPGLCVDPLETINKLYMQLVL